MLNTTSIQIDNGGFADTSSKHSLGKPSAHSCERSEPGGRWGGSGCENDWSPVASTAVGHPVGLCDVVDRVNTLDCTRLDAIDPALAGPAFGLAKSGD